MNIEEEIKFSQDLDIKILEIKKVIDNEFLLKIKNLDLKIQNIKNSIIKLKTQVTGSINIICEKKNLASNYNCLEKQFFYKIINYKQIDYLTLFKYYLTDEKDYSKKMRISSDLVIKSNDYYFKKYTFSYFYGIFLLIFLSFFIFFLIYLFFKIFLKSYFLFRLKNHLTITCNLLEENKELNEYEIIDID